MNNIDTHSFFLNDKDKTISINFSGNKKILPGEFVTSIMDVNNIYESERSKSNIFRLIFSINPFCSNILFNPFTEVVYKEGSEDAYCLNFHPKKSSELLTFDNIIAKESSFTWNETESVRDTQLSSTVHGFDYNCGLDIFNNHLLRSRTFKSVNYSDTYSKQEINSFNVFYGGNNGRAIEGAAKHKYVGNYFNTIDDYLRDKFGVIVSEDVSINMGEEKNHYRIMPLHIYQDGDIYSFDECLQHKKLNENGWYGFSNPSSFSFLNYIVKSNNDEIISTTDANAEVNSIELGINKVINNKKYCEFIDLYPGRDLYSFLPKYNPYRKRLEKNWNYCLTYPSKSVIKQNDSTPFPFLKIVGANEKTGLKALMIDELTKNDAEQSVLTVYSISQHGLQVGDTVNIYSQYEGIDESNNVTTINDLVYESAEVIEVVDKYVFQVIKSERNISKKWIELKELPENFLTMYNGKPYRVCASKRSNVDDNAQDVYFRRVVNGVECEYYVRKFSRIPNFKFAEEEINDFYLYDDNFNKKRKENGKKTLLEEYAVPTNTKSEFENHIAKLGFSNNAYGDDNVEIVFTDDIDVSYLKDNLGRPLSEIYLTIIKNNKGYRQWYDGLIANAQNIEYSHCFGKNNCSFLLSDYYRAMYNKDDVRSIDSGQKVGLIKSGVDDEIDFYNDFEFYGDLCCYSPLDCEEEVIQKVMNRFNTVQREININGSTFEGKRYFTSLTVDELNDTETNLAVSGQDSRLNDGWEAFNSGSFLKHSKKVTYNNMTQQSEGYYYLPNYKVQIKKVSDALSSSDAIKYTIYNAVKKGTNDDNRTVFQIKTFFDNNFKLNEKLVLYKKSTNEYFFVTVIGLITDNRFECVIANEDGMHISSLINENNISDFVLLKKHEDTPEYARLVKDGSCRFCWREIVTNGTENDSETYPFTNGAFYITKKINFFLRRQDPEENFLYTYFKTNVKYKYLIPKEGEFISHNIQEYDTYYKDEEIREC